jgi:hypothetical protein
MEVNPDDPLKPETVMLPFSCEFIPAATPAAEINDFARKLLRVVLICLLLVIITLKR